MMLVDYGGSIFPIIAHSPWNGLHLADFVMPFFLFIAGVSLALVYKVLTKFIEFFYIEFGNFAVFDFQLSTFKFSIVIGNRRLI